jgi:hypothetical protein
VVTLEKRIQVSSLNDVQVFLWLGNKSSLNKILRNLHTTRHSLLKRRRNIDNNTINLRNVIPNEAGQH